MVMQVLLQQRQHDSEAKEVFQIIHGGQASQNRLFPSVDEDLEEYPSTDAYSVPSEYAIPDNLEIYEEF